MINEEIAGQIGVICFQAVRFGESELEAVFRAYLGRKAEGVRGHGKIKLKDLMQQDQGASAMEISADSIKGFEKIASKYNVDFAVTRDKSKQPPLYQVFFKGRDQDVIAKAFNEYVHRQEMRAARVPFKVKLQKLKEKADKLNQMRTANEKFRFKEKTL